MNSTRKAAACGLLGVGLVLEAETVVHAYNGDLIAAGYLAVALIICALAVVIWPAPEHLKPEAK